MELEVRTITDADLEAWSDASSRGFHGFPLPGAAELNRRWFDLSRTRAAFDRDALVGTLRSFAVEQTLPGGGVVPMSGLSQVTVAATHRRQGLLNRMIGPDLHESRDRGESASILIAAEYPIYGRYGYGPATEHCTLVLDAGAASFVTQPVRASVELVDQKTMRDLAPPVYDHVRRATPGAIGRSDLWWDVTLGLADPNQPWTKQYLAVLREGEMATGYLRYRIEGAWDDRRARSTLVVDELVGVSASAEARLWRYCAEVDWVTRVKAENRPVDDVLPLFVVDARMVKTAQRDDLIWLRPLDAVRLLGSRRYQAAGSVVVDVVDPMGFANGRFRLDVDTDGACTCAVTAGVAADITLPVSVLGAISLGGFNLARFHAAGLVDEHTAGAVARTAAMFGWPRVPFCSTWF